MCDHVILQDVFADPLVWRLRSTNGQYYVKRIHLDNKAKESITFYLHSSNTSRVFPYPKYGILPPESQRYVRVKVGGFSAPTPCKEYVVVAFAVVPKNANYKTAGQLWSGFDQPLLVRKTFTVQFLYEPENVSCTKSLLEDPYALQTPSSHFDSDEESKEDSDNLEK
ncbi:Major sperm protein [Trichuris trichiura]|uniref:Major sperm protein n=1 Tax=Trichuris trichiura TaxID=36087 RepID=A0A077ZIU2_TRITR|nr:Major sperm protein [Trichuris trichiura]